MRRRPLMILALCLCALSTGCAEGPSPGSRQADALRTFRSSSENRIYKNMLKTSPANEAMESGGSAK